jgi:hypothetical protein
LESKKELNLLSDFSDSLDFLSLSSLNCFSTIDLVAPDAAPVIITIHTFFATSTIVFIALELKCIPMFIKAKNMMNTYN